MAEDDGAEDVAAEGAGGDEYFDEAITALTTFFRARRGEVFYERQLAVMFESRGKSVSLTPVEDRGRVEERLLSLKHGFYHWVTVRALKYLVDARVLASAPYPLGVREGESEEGSSLTLYRHPRHLHWKRQAREIAALVRQFSDHSFGKAIGRHAEQMFDAEIQSEGFRRMAKDVREWNGVRWEGAHELDRVYSKDGEDYGIEIKNTLKYIPRTELNVKVKMCRRLGLVPVFIVRMAPGSWVVEVDRDHGGYTLIFKYQFYRHGDEKLAGHVQQRLELPIGHELATRTVKRLTEFHQRRLDRRK